MRISAICLVLCGCSTIAGLDLDGYHAASDAQADGSGGGGRSLSDASGDRASGGAGGSLADDTSPPEDGSRDAAGESASGGRDAAGDAAGDTLTRDVQDAGDAAEDRTASGQDGAIGSVCNDGDECQSGHCATGRCVAPPSWGTVTILDQATTPAVTAVGTPSVAVERAGKGMVAWRHMERAYAQRYEGGVWEAISILDDPAGGSIDNPYVAHIGSGKYVAVWHKSVSHYLVYMSTFSAGAWAKATVLSHDGLDNEWNPYTSINNSGDGAVIWTTSVANGPLWLRRFSSGVPQTIEQATASSGGGFIVAAPNGKLLVAWSTASGGFSEIWARTYDPIDGWTMPISVAKETGEFGVTAIALRDTGEFAVAWLRTLSPRSHILWASYFTPPAGVSAPVLVDVDELGDSSSTNVAFDAAGNLMVAWNRIPAIWLRVRSANATWSDPMMLNAPETGGVLPLVAPYGLANFRISYDPYGDPPVPGFFDIRYVGRQKLRDRQQLDAEPLTEEGRSIALLPDGRGLMAWRHRKTLAQPSEYSIRASWLE